MRIEAVTVCVDYADFLEVAAQENAGLFDRWIVVTSPRDLDTREVCRRHNLECLQTDDFYRDGMEFNKARGINRGLVQVSADCWRLHVDADIVLPRCFRRALELAHLDPHAIYGVDRVMVRSWSEWLSFKASGHLNHSYHHAITFPPFTLGTRFASSLHGWLPIGFFQLWHSDADEWRGIRSRHYPHHHNTAARCDVQFALQWDRQKRVLLPEVVAVHLDSESAACGVNWAGRRTSRFGHGNPSRDAGCVS